MYKVGWNPLWQAVVVGPVLNVCKSAWVGEATMDEVQWRIGSGDERLTGKVQTRTVEKIPCMMFVLR